MRYVHNQTVKGASHADAGGECQDASLSWKNEDMAMIIVSDGHGGERHKNSAIGAKLSCQITMSHLREFCNNVGNEWLIHNSKNTIRRLCISILAEWIHQCVSGL